MPPQKIYIIDPPKRNATPSAPERSRDRSAKPRRAWRRSGGRTDDPADSRGEGWALALRAYALGPLHLILRPRGTYRVAWAIGSGVSLAAAAALFTQWNSLPLILGRLGQGTLVWAAVVSFVILANAAGWARSVATSPRRPRWPRFARSPVAVCVAGLVLPGLGLLVAGRRGKAALALWSAGLVAASVTVAARWRWIAGGAAAGSSGTQSAAEAVLVAAAAGVVLGSLAWLASAFDGVREVAPVTRSPRLADALAVAFAATLVLAAVTIRPVSVAEELVFLADQFRSEGMRWAPLALYEIACLADPSRPEYAVEAIDLYDRVGMKHAAGVKRRMLESRAEEFAQAVGANLVFCVQPAENREASSDSILFPSYAR